ncbi:hypothetical protein GF386_04270 [Candidatus Pacearchaeota archaeon]|nr:hypothetical protein [Candidatus Pacearchaeota archaeon]MBD3283340.1 hypothetical protein [Candidatus Pacearchaeota archaeon]
MSEFRSKEKEKKLGSWSRSDYDIDRVLDESRYKKDLSKLKELIDKLKSSGIVVEV